MERFVEKKEFIEVVGCPASHPTVIPSVPEAFFWPAQRSLGPPTLWSRLYDVYMKVNGQCEKRGQEKKKRERKRTQPSRKVVAERPASRSAVTSSVPIRVFLAGSAQR
jgi:hypothetical protein